MQVILRDDSDNLGKSGEVVNVKPGYARNYLLPRGLAVKATATDVAQVEHEKRLIAARAAKQAKEAQGEADRLSQVSVSIRLDVLELTERRLVVFGHGDSRVRFEVKEGEVELSHSAPFEDDEGAFDFEEAVFGGVDEPKRRRDG